MHWFKLVSRSPCCETRRISPRFCVRVLRHRNPSESRGCGRVAELSTFATHGSWGVRLSAPSPAATKPNTTTGETSDMKLTQFRTSIQAYDVWSPVVFSAALSFITMVANVAGSFATGNSDVGMITFIAFLPMAFYFASVSHKQTREHIKVLEARIQQLEADKAASS